MSLLTKIKAALAIAVTAAIAILYSLFRIEKADREKAESDLAKAKEANEQSSKALKAKEEVINVKDKVRTASTSDIDDGMRKYDRSKNN